MNGTVPPNSSSFCEPSPHRWAYVFLIPLPLLSGLINILVWLAATFYRKKLLRQSYVYSCVTSTLLSNALFLSFHLWDEIAGFQMPPAIEMMRPVAFAGIGGEVRYFLLEIVFRLS